LSIKNIIIALLILSWRELVFWIANEHENTVFHKVLLSGVFLTVNITILCGISLNPSIKKISLLIQLIIFVAGSMLWFLGMATHHESLCITGTRIAKITENGMLILVAIFSEPFILPKKRGQPL